MPTRNVSLTVELDAYISSRLSTGRFDNASEVIRAGLRALEREEQEQAEKLAALRNAIQHGLDSGVAKGDVFARVRKKLGLPAKPSRLTHARRK